MIPVMDASTETPIVISSLPNERWRDFRELRLRALRSGAAFAQSLPAASAQPEELWRQRLRDAAQGRAWLLFASRGEELVGIAGAYVPDQRTPCASIWGVYVDDVVRGRGVGTALLTALLDRLCQAGIATARLTVNRDQGAAVRLYERLGFQAIGLARAPLGDGHVHEELVMERELGGQQARLKAPQPGSDPTSVPPAKSA
jgi:ribosomal protein S18 acetylase RimI-like enzyme